MQTVKHKNFGVGEVVGRRDTDNGVRVTVRFDNGREMELAIPESFTSGIVEAQGSLKDEVDAAVAKKKADEEERVRAALGKKLISGTHTSRGAGSTPVKHKGPIEQGYEEHLIKCGYSVETPSGLPSTVNSYISAIENHVLGAEKMNWGMLKDNIGNIVKKYGPGGPKEDIGAKSKCTVINALRRFEEYVNS